MLILTGCVPIDQIPQESSIGATPESSSLEATLASANRQSRRDAARAYTNALAAPGVALKNEMLPPLVKGIEDDDGDVRLYSLAGLEILAEAANLKQQRGVSRPYNKHLTVVLNDNNRLYFALLRTVEDPRAEIRLRSVSILIYGFRERSTTEEVFNKQLAFERDGRIREKFLAGLALAPFKSAQTLMNLRAALQAPDTTMRDRVGRRLAQLGDKQALRIIVELLGVNPTKLRPDLWNVVGQYRGAARDYLGQLRIARAAITDPNEMVIADAALRAIRRGN